jgi:hyperosmotically inducible periplasmic protein
MPNPKFCSLLAALTLTFVIPALRAPSLYAQEASGAWTREEAQNIAVQVGKKITALTTYSVFDDVSIAINGKTVILRGYASRPALKSDATRAVKSIRGVESVDNQLEVLPASPSDDRVRTEVYNAIYTQPSLRKYNANAGNLASAGDHDTALLAAGGITEDPPLGFHAIHIIVKNGNVILTGTVLDKQDSELAQIKANSAFGAHGITNQLTIQGAPVGK